MLIALTASQQVRGLAHSGFTQNSPCFLEIVLHCSLAQFLRDHLMPIQKEGSSCQDTSTSK